MRITLIEDVITTGGAVRDATLALRVEGARIAVVVCAICSYGSPLATGQDARSPIMSSMSAGEGEVLNAKVGHALRQFGRPSPTLSESLAAPVAVISVSAATIEFIGDVLPLPPRVGFRGTGVDGRLAAHRPSVHPSIRPSVHPSTATTRPAVSTTVAVDSTPISVAQRTAAATRSLGTGKATTDNLISLSEVGWAHECLSGPFIAHYHG